jgi:IPT/TIG domain
MKYSVLILFFASLFLWTACQKTVDNTPPTIEKIRVTSKDSTIEGAGVGNTIAIIGKNFSSTQTILFNDYSVPVNPSYIKDDVILVQIPIKAPYRNQINKVKVITLYGEAVKDFSIVQPAPTIKKFAPSSGNPGDVITITGKDLDNVKEVKIGETIATVLSGGSDSLLQITVPVDGTQGKITVATIGGQTKSTSSFGISLIIYDDKMASGWDAYEWDATRDMKNTEQVKKGKSIKMTYLKAYGGFGVGASTKIDVIKYSAVKLSIYVTGNASETKLKAGIKGADGTTNKFSKILVLKPGWNDLTLDFIQDLSSPDRFVEFQLQEWGNATLPVIYIEDLGLL